MEILYISHCVPWPPDKGDRIRAFHSLRRLVEHHRIHLACLARSDAEAAAASELRSRCASVRIEVLHRNSAIVRGLARFAAGDSFTAAFYSHPALHAHVRSILASRPIGAAIILSPPMGPYAPQSVPFIADWGDVDSEKWFQYAQMRFLGFAHRLEARRLRKVERDYALRSRRTFFVTANELDLFRRIAPDAPVGLCGNGVDTATFDPGAAFAKPADLTSRKFVAFVGVLNYFPNSDGVCRFAETVFPELRRRDPQLELFLVGRNPARSVMQLGKMDGITVTGTVDDVRPYLAAARAVIAPLRIARGVQNKVLEALAMGKRVLASDEVCRTFMPDLPKGIVCCRSADDYVRATAALPATSEPDMAIADAARRRFTWEASLDPLIAELDQIEHEREPRAAHAQA